MTAINPSSRIKFGIDAKAGLIIDNREARTAGISDNQVLRRPVPRMRNWSRRIDRLKRGRRTTPKRAIIPPTCHGNGAATLFRGFCGSTRIGQPGEAEVCQRPTLPGETGNGVATSDDIRLLDRLITGFDPLQSAARDFHWRTCGDAETQQVGIPRHDIDMAAGYSQSRNPTRNRSALTGLVPDPAAYVGMPEALGVPEPD
ncbi:hypothetical protein SDC9_128522 [bioreactor metagenome]|uniref:Uncharacterized protein n=1 Tax=bioreactor metagenome TaxID=1076179 RepID=A0A645CX32_9ZZZZ